MYGRNLNLRRGVIPMNTKTLNIRTSAALSRSVVRVLITSLALIFMGVISAPKAYAVCPEKNPECHPLSPPEPQPGPPPPPPSASPDGEFPIALYRIVIEKVGNEILQKFRELGIPGTLSWNGLPPTRCGYACVDPPSAPWLYSQAAITKGWLKFHYDAGGDFWKDFVIQTELDATCQNWQTGQGHLRLNFVVLPIALSDGGSWFTDVVDFFTDNYTTDLLINKANQLLAMYAGQQDLGDFADRGTCRSLGVSIDPPRGYLDAFVWDSAFLSGQIFGGSQK
jgi:hypothetical protein